MSTKTWLMMAAVSVVTACSCFGPAPQPPAAPVAAVLPATEPTPMVKEAEQVIAIAEKGGGEAAAALPATAEAAAASAGVSRCWLKGDLRTIITEQGKDGSCQVVYESAGQHHVVANKSRELADCTRLHQRLKKNLVASGFSCE